MNGELIAAAAVAAVLLLISAKRYIHVLQLEGYRGNRYMKWLFGANSRYLRLWLAGAVCFLLYFTLGLAEVDEFVHVVAPLAAFFLFLILLCVETIRFKAKKKLVFTNRVKRLYCLLTLIVAASVLVVPVFRFFADGDVARDVSVYLILISPIFLPLAVALANLIMLPVEWAIKRYYYNDAKRKINGLHSLIKIGITGSYGKTSTKFFLGTILSEKYNTLVTPSSFNTPMGLARVIRESLTDSHEVFIAEMGARHVGDIRELCELVRPKYGIITSIGKQHLDTFKSLENVIATKNELIEALPPDGVAFFPADNKYCLALYEKTAKPRRLYGIEEHPNLSAQAKDIRLGPWGSRFTLVCGDESIECTTTLLGAHNVLNILGCCSIARELGLTMEQIAAGIAKLEPVEHRLQLIPTTNGVTVIDDAFNANPAGVRAAMDVLEQFEGRKIVVTPGMVELGAEEKDHNWAFGCRLAQTADIVILVGPRHTQPIREGLVYQGMDMDNVYTVSTLAEATATLAKLTRVGDVVLFENDLPDNYDEK